MANKKIRFTLELDVKDGVLQVGNLDKKLDGLKKKIIQVEQAGENMNDALRQGGSNAGLAGAAITELGRTVSDYNYGVTAMANNVNQLSTLFITLIKKTGGVRLAFKALWAEIMGPLGLILAFQLLITLLESKAMEEDKATDSAKRHREEIEKQIKAVRELNEVSQWHVNLSKDIVRLEQDLADTKLYDPTNWQKIADIRTKIINKQLELLKAEKASVGDLLTGPEQLALNTKIYELERERARIRDEEYKKRKKAKAEGLTDPDAWTKEDEENMKYRLFAFRERQRLREEEEDAEIAANDRELQRLLAMRDARRKALEEEQRIRQEDLEHRMIIFDAIGSGLQSLSILLGEETAKGKALAAAGALIDTFAAINGILKNTARTAAGGIPGYAIAQAVATGLFGLAQVKKIYDVNVPGGGGSGGGSGGVGTTVTPQFNVIGATGPNRIAEAVRSEMSKPTRAYVTTKDIRSGQELERNTRSGATL